MRTLEKYLKKQKEPEISIIVGEIIKSGKDIYQKLKNIGINAFYLESEEKNASGDNPKKIDIYAHNLLVENLKSTNLVSKIGSEESEELIECGDFISNKVYDVYFDPLDGSSNLECSGGTGTIFGIFPSSRGGKYDEEYRFPKGRDIVCSGYLYYSSSLVLTITFGKGTFMFTYDGEQFVENIKSPIVITDKSKRIYSINEGSKDKWNDILKEQIEVFKKENYSLRYIGSMVADVHRTLLHGGVFIHPNKKLRLLYECIPISFLVENCEGVSYSDETKVLDLTPDSLHQKVPIVLGCQRDVYYFS